MARVTVLVWAARKRTAVRWVVAVLVFRRIRVAVVVAIGVVGLLVIHRNLIARVLVVIPVVVVALATPQQK